MLSCQLEGRSKIQFLTTVIKKEKKATKTASHCQLISFVIFVLFFFKWLPFPRQTNYCLVPTGKMWTKLWPSYTVFVSDCRKVCTARLYCCATCNHGYCINHWCWEFQRTGAINQTFAAFSCIKNSLFALSNWRGNNITHDAEQRQLASGKETYSYKLRWFFCCIAKLLETNSN